MNPRWTGLGKFSSVYLRLALGISFLSAVADRFGFWGAYGRPNVAWGSFARFEGYTAKLNWFLPAAVIPALSIIVTAAEALFGVLLIGIVAGLVTRSWLFFSVIIAVGAEVITHTAAAGRGEGSR